MFRDIWLNLHNNNLYIGIVLTTRLTVSSISTQFYLPLGSDFIKRELNWLTTKCFKVICINKAQLSKTPAKRTR